MVVAFEGMDGCGKSSMAKYTAEATKMSYIEKPIAQLLNIDKPTFAMLETEIAKIDNEEYKAFFYLLGNLYAAKQKNAIIDRHVLSTYFWNGCAETIKLFQKAINLGVAPNLSIILYADIESRISHIKSRNPNDKDLSNSKKMLFGYDKMIEFADLYDLNYVIINTEKFEYFDIVSECIKIVNLTKEKLPNEVKEYCNNYNNDNSIKKYIKRWQI